MRRASAVAIDQDRPSPRRPAGRQALFLCGVRLVGERLQRAASTRLRHVLSTLSGKRLKALAVGAGVTALLQPSSATTVMLVGFASAGLLSLRQTIGVILGADSERAAVGRSLPAGVPPEAVDTARDTLGGAVAVSAELPPQIGSALVEAARVSFVDGIHVVAAVTTVVALAAAIAAARLLWNVSKRADHAEAAVTTQEAASA